MTLQSTSVNVAPDPLDRSLAAESKARPAAKEQTLPDWLILGTAAPVGFVLALVVQFFTAVAPIGAVGAGVAIGALILSLTSFVSIRWFLLLVLMVRPALDDLVFDDLGLFQPGTVVGLLVLVICAGWLFDSYRAGRLEQISKLSMALCFYALAITLSSPGSLTVFESLTGSLKVWSIAALFMVLEQLFRHNPESIWQFLAAGAASLIIPISTAAVQAFWTGSVDEVSGLVRIDGPFVHSNPFATYLVVVALIAAPVFLRSTGARRLTAGAVLTLTSITIVLTYARAGWGSLLLGLAVVGLRLDRRLLIVIGAGIVVAVMANPSTITRLSELTADEDPTLSYENPNSLEWRVGYWFEILPLANSNPLTGLGLDTVEKVTAVELPPHNSFVQAFVEAGIIGLSGLLVAVTMVWKLLRRAATASLGNEHLVITSAATAAALSVFLQLFTENLITGVTPIWYMFVPVAWVSASELTTRRKRHVEEPNEFPALVLGIEMNRS